MRSTIFGLAFGSRSPRPLYTSPDCGLAIFSGFFTVLSFTTFTSAGVHPDSQSLTPPRRERSA